MHGPVEQQWLLHSALSLGFQVSVLSVKQAAYRRARCAHTALWLISLRAQDHQPIQLLALSLSRSLPKHKISPGVSFKVCLVKCESIQELEGETSADTYALYAAPVGMGNHFESRALAHLGQMHTILSRVAQHFINLFFYPSVGSVATTQFS